MGGRSQAALYSTFGVLLLLKADLFCWLGHVGLELRDFRAVTNRHSHSDLKTADLKISERRQ